MKIHKESIMMCLVAAVAALTLVALAAASGASRATATANDDDRVIATVEGIPVTLSPIRTGSSLVRSMSPQISEADSVRLIMTEIFGRKALLAEAVRLGLDGTAEGYAQYEKSRALLNDPEGRPVTLQRIRELGMTDEQYWSEARRVLSRQQPSSSYGTSISTKLDSQVLPMKRSGKSGGVILPTCSPKRP